MALPVIQRPAAFTGILSRSRSRIVSHKRVHRGIYGLFRHAGAPSAAVHAARFTSQEQRWASLPWPAFRSNPSTAPPATAARSSCCWTCRTASSIHAAATARCAGAGVPLQPALPAGPQVVRGQNHLQLYQFNTHVAEHYFCGVCGIYTHHRRRSTRTSTATTWRAWKASTRLRWGHSGQRRGQPPVRPHRLVARAPRRAATFCQGAMPLRPARTGRFSQGRRGGACGRVRDRGGSGLRRARDGRAATWRVSVGTGTINIRPGWAWAA